MKPRFGKSNFGSMIKVGALVAGLALVGTACGGDDGGGGVDKDAARAELTALLSDEGMPEELVSCLVDAALDTFSASDLESVLADGDPSPEAEAAFTEEALKCSALGG